MTRWRLARAYACMSVWFGLTGCTDSAADDVADADAMFMPINLPAARDAGQDADAADHDAQTSEAVLCAAHTEQPCPVGCYALDGRLQDARGCWHQKQVIACAFMGQAFSELGGCYVDESTGAVYQTPALYFGNVRGWRLCTAQESAAFPSSACK